MDFLFNYTWAQHREHNRYYPPPDCQYCFPNSDKDEDRT